MPARIRSALKLALAVVLLVGAAALVRTWPAEVSGRRVVVGAVVDEVLGVGTLESARAVRVAFEVPGRVTSLAADEGDLVSEGQLLGALDVSDSQADLAVAEASESVSRAAVARASAELERGRVAAERATAERARAEALFAGGTISASARDDALERDRSAIANVRALEAALRQASRAREVASRTTRVRAGQVADGRLLSPLSGLVVTRHVEAGQLVTPGVPAFTVVATGAMRVRAWVDESALGRLAVGQPARLVFRSEGERSFAGRVERIGREVDRQTHEVLVDVTALELPANFAVGQRADVWIEVDRRDDVPRVPRGWCDATCLVAEDGRARTRDVQLGLVGRDAVEVVRGLAPGEVVLPPRSTADGRRILLAELP